MDTKATLQIATDKLDPNVIVKLLASFQAVKPDLCFTDPNGVAVYDTGFA